MKMQHPSVLAPLWLLIGLVALSPGVSGQGGGNSDAMVLLLEQNRNLQTELQALRALVEQQGYEIRRLQRESLDRYTDTDNRLRGLEQALAGGGAVGTAPSTNGIVESPLPSTPTDGIQAGQPGTPGPVQTAPVAEATGQATSTRGLVAGAGTDINSGAAQQSRGPVVSRATLEPAVLTEQQLYQMAYDSAINSQFERAIAEFDQYLGIYPQGRFTTNAHYWKGQSYLYLSRYDEAIAEYTIILDQYPDDAKVPDSLYGQAVAYEGMGDDQRARRLLQQIIRNYPNTGVANLADTRLRSLN